MNPLPCDKHGKTLDHGDPVQCSAGRHYRVLRSRTVNGRWRTTVKHVSGIGELIDDSDQYEKTI
jgi:hypothetical protein